MHSRSRKKTTKYNLLIRYVSIALAMVSGVVLVPIYLRFIPLDVYGAWLATGNILAWLSTMDPGLTGVLQQRVGYAYGKQDIQAIRELLGGGLFLAGIVSITTIIFGFVCTHYLSVWLDLPSNVDVSLIEKSFSLAVIGTALMLLSFSIFAINQGLQGNLGVGLISNVVAAFSLLLNIILLYKGFGLLALAISLLFSGICSALGQGVYLFWRLSGEKIGLNFSFRNVLGLTKILSYTFIGRAAGIVANNADLFIVARFLGPETVAVLSLTRKAPDFSKEFVNQPSVAFMPAVSHLIGSGEIDKAQDALIRLVRILLWVLFLVVGGLISLNGDFVRLWVGPRLFAGETINIIICVAIIFTLSANCLGNICFALGNIKGNSLATLIQSILFIPLVIYGTKYFGLLGTVLAPLISVLAVSVWYFPKIFSKLLKLSVKDRKEIMHEGFLTLVAIVPLILGFSWIHPKNWIHFIALVAMFCLLYCCLIYLVSKCFRGEFRRVIQKIPINGGFLTSN